MHDNEHVVRVNAEPAQQAFNILFRGSTVLQLKPVFSVPSQDTREKKLVFAVLRNWAFVASFAVV
jgi:hypothetical protein